MAESLFTVQTPVVADASDGTPGISTATTVEFAVAGNVTGIRFRATTNLGGTYNITGELWQVTSGEPSPAGTLLATKAVVSTSFSAGAWNVITFDSPVAVAVNTLYRAVIHNADGRYVATLNFFDGVDLTNGNITAYRDGDDHLLIGSIRQGTFGINASAGSFPIGSSGHACYFADVVFEAAGGTTNIDTTDSAALTDAGAVAVAAPAADSATLADVALVVAAASVTDDGTLTDAGAVGATAGVVDSATMTDGSALDAGQAGVDVFTLTESSVVQAAINAADAGTLTDLGIVFTGGTFVPVMGGSVVVMTLGGYASLA